MLAALVQLKRRLPWRFAALARLAFGCAMIVGCAEPSVELTTAGDASDAPPLTPAKLDSGQPAPSITPTAIETPDGALASAYQPPFPDRVELFVPPKRDGGAPTEGVQQNSVELIGFVRVDRQRAVLSIDGNVASIPAGETQFGVQVISINPPKVELQRGRQRWQATLE